jgi:ribosomal protein S18 acetylase RimI-like enzyme
MKKVSTLLKKIIMYLIVRIHGLTIYRRIARVLGYAIKIKEADIEDMRKFYEWQNPEKENVYSYDPAITNFVAKISNKIIGFVQLTRCPEGNNLYSGYWLFSLITGVSYRGMGTGEKLSKKVIEKAINEGAIKLSLLVFEDNHKAIRLYQKLGFKNRIIPAFEEELEKDRISFNGRRRILMIKDLSPRKNKQEGTE